MKLTSTKQMDAESDRLKGLIKKLRERLGALKITAASLDKEAATLRSQSVRHGDSDAAARLDGMRTLIDFSDREIQDLTKEIETCECELAELAAARTISLKDENFAAFAKESKLAVAEAAKLDEALGALHKLTISHRDRLARMSMFLRESGVDGRNLDLAAPVAEDPGHLAQPLAVRNFPPAPRVQRQELRRDFEASV